MNLYVVCGFFSISGCWSLLTVSFEHDFVNLYFWYDVLVDVLKKWLRLRCFRQRIDWNWAPDDVVDLLDFLRFIRLMQSERECGFSDIHSWLLLLWLERRLRLLAVVWSAFIMLALLILLWLRLLLWFTLLMYLYELALALLYEWFRLLVKGFVAW